MEKFIGTKIIKAKPMTRGDYNRYRGWELPENENVQDEGMLVEYLDGGKSNHQNHEGYISWSPKDVFDNAYHSVNNMTFGDAVFMLKQGEKIARAGWNEKGLFLYFVPENIYQAQTYAARQFFGDLVPYRAYIAMKTAQNDVVPWVASQTDILAEDWFIV